MDIYLKPGWYRIQGSPGTVVKDGEKEIIDGEFLLDVTVEVFKEKKFTVEGDVETWKIK